jgi:CheY-like chemotaxis protein
MRMSALTKDLEVAMARSKILVDDDEYQTRKVIRTLLLAMGCTRIYEAQDGSGGLEAELALLPDVVLLDWDMRGIAGADRRVGGEARKLAS